MDIEIENMLPKASNQGILRIASLTFCLFVIAEFIGAYFSHSLSLYGDACAMSVDVFTYFCNMFAEYAKEYSVGKKSTIFRVIVNVAVPSLAVGTLLGVTFMIVKEAVKVLHSAQAHDGVDVFFLYFFSLLNLVLDVYCVIMFYTRGKEVFYESPPIPQLSLDTSVHSDGSEEFGHLDDDFDGAAQLDNGERTRNLNMISAFTHIGGDSLRTASVFVAAIFSSTAGINADICDAWAAIAVSGTIIVVVIPLVIDIGRAALAIYSNRDGYRRVEVDDDAGLVMNKRIVGKSPKSDIASLFR